MTLTGPGPGLSALPPPPTALPPFPTPPPQSGLLLGAMRAHMPTRGSAALELALGEAASQPPMQARVQVEVHFPHLEPEELRVLWAARQVGGWLGECAGDGGKPSLR